VSAIARAAEISGYAVWVLIAWAALNRLVLLAERLESRYRYRRMARRYVGHSKAPPESGVSRSKKV
jgi:hypothetical protein